LKIRKKALKLDELHMYDIYCPIAAESRRKFTWQEALDLVRNGLKPLGGQYIEDLSRGLTEGWIDVYESEGKTSGAYSWGAYLTHPFVLMNYQGTMNDVFTLAHEMGPAMHSYYTNRLSLTFILLQNLCREVASTVNESILMHHLLERTEKKEEKAYLLNHYLEEFRGTKFRQVMFAEFEK
jgi:oligoendopeptidase F